MLSGFLYELSFPSNEEHTTGRRSAVVNVRVLLLYVSVSHLWRPSVSRPVMYDLMYKRVDLGFFFLFFGGRDLPIEKCCHL